MHFNLADLLGSYGYVLLALLVGLEGLGIPLPGEMALVTSAALAARGHLSITGVVVTTIVAAICGDNGGYWIGRKGGLALIERYGKYLHIRDTHLTRAHAFFEKHGSKTVFIGRFFALLRVFAAVLAGASRMRYRTFVIWNAAGVVAWTATFATLGYLFGRHLPMLQRHIGRATLAAVLLLALVAVLMLWWRWFEKNRMRLAEASAARWRRVLATPWLLRFGYRHPHVWELLSTRFARAEYLGVHMTVGFVISLLGLWLFGGITEDIVDHESLLQFDMVLLDWVHAHATPFGYQVANAISLAGSPATIAVLAAGVTLVLAARRKWIYALGWLATLAGSGLLITMLKLLVQRTRPAYATSFMDDGSWNFSSGHAMGSLVCYGMLGYLVVALVATRTWTRVSVGLAVAVLAVAIGASRMYLGVHYFSDVIGGYAAGVLWLSACVSGVEIVKGSGESV